MILTCPTCGDPGYCATNDGGSIGGCTKCNKTYASEAYKTEVVTEKGKTLSRKKIKLEQKKLRENVFNVV